MDDGKGRGARHNTDHASVDPTIPMIPTTNGATLRVARRCIRHSDASGQLFGREQEILRVVVRGLRRTNMTGRASAARTSREATNSASSRSLRTPC
jgi:hypothetical protein